MLLRGFNYSDREGDPTDRKSVEGYCSIVGSVDISWCFKNQYLTSKSFCKAEYRTLSDASCEIIWIKSLLAEFGVAVSFQVPLNCDDKTTLDWAANPVY